MTGPTNLGKLSTAALRRRRAALLRRLPPLEAIVRGSLIERYKRCGKPGCHCQQGRGHGPKFYLSVSMPGTRPVMEYVPNAYLETVQAFVENFQQARQSLEQICAINLELLRRREELE
jgi:hypothetical protein